MITASVACLALALYHEARGEPSEGQYAVGQVILNRVDDSRYPNTICDVVYDDGEFSFVGSVGGIHNKKAYEEVLYVALDLVNRVEYDLGATHYHTTAVDPYWNEVFDYEAQVGSHVFYINNTPWR